MVAHSYLDIMKIVVCMSSVSRERSFQKVITLSLFNIK